MNLLFCHDTYYARSPDNNVYSYGAFPYALWSERFLDNFKNITVIGREKEYEPSSASGLELSSGPNVSFELLQNINTPLKRIFCSSPIKKKINDLVKQADAIVIRGPVEFGMIAAKAARKHKKPYAVEMSGCAFDHTWYHGSIIGKAYAPFKYLRARHMLKHADAVIYVTQNFLQKRYPTNTLSEHASNVEIVAPSSEILQKRLSRIEKTNNKVIFGLIGHVENQLKGLKVAMTALSQLKNELPDFELRVLGQGNPQFWQSDIDKLGLSEKVTFSGTLPGGEAVLNWLDDVDIYMQPSYHEGLPRALIEAMSRGCPSLASTAGGTDELLPSHYIHTKGDVTTLKKHIKSILDKEKQLEAAQNNFKTAQNYTKEVLIPRREQFWKQFVRVIKENQSRQP